MANKRELKKYRITVHYDTFGRVRDEKVEIMAHDLPEAIQLYQNVRGDAGDAAAIVAVKYIDETPVFVTTYRQRRKYANAEAAIDFFEECAAGSEGSERERYENVLDQLRRGRKEVFDERR